MGKLRAIPIADLVWDESIYPRHNVDRSYVWELVRALEGGAQLPPPTIEERTLRIVDGVHRIEAHRIFDPDIPLECLVERYADEAAVIAAAISANATHGRKLDVQDKTRAALMLQKHGYNVERIAIALHTTPARVEQLTIRVVQVGKETLPAKPVCYPERGESPRRLSADQYDVMRSSSGLRTAQTITQLTNELKAGLVDVMKHRDGLECLRDTIGDALRMEVSA